MGEWVRVAKKQDIPLGSGVISELGGKSIAVFHVKNQFYAINNLCPHRGGPLGDGELSGLIVTCPWHAWKFDVTNGVSPENNQIKVKSYAVRLSNDDVLIEME